MQVVICCRGDEKHQQDLLNHRRGSQKTNPPVKLAPSQRKMTQTYCFLMTFCIEDLVTLRLSSASKPSTKSISGA